MSITNQKYVLMSAYYRLYIVTYMLFICYCLYAILCVLLLMRYGVCVIA